MELPLITTPPFPFRQEGDHNTVNSQQVDVIKTMSHFLSRMAQAMPAFLAELDRSSSSPIVAMVFMYC